MGSFELACMPLSSANTLPQEVSQPHVSDSAVELAADPVAVEPICARTDDRFALFPIRDPELWAMYKQAEVPGWHEMPLVSPHTFPSNLRGAVASCHPLTLTLPARFWLVVIGMFLDCGGS